MWSKRKVYSEKSLFNDLSDNKIWALSKLKAFAYDNFIVAQMMEFFFDRVERKCQFFRHLHIAGLAG